MLYFLYDLFFCIAFIGVAPWILWRRWMFKQFKGRFAAYFTLSLPAVKVKKGKVFLIYAVSMGETKIAATLFQQMKGRYPEDQFYIVSRSETGHAEAKKSISAADGHFFLPLDFSWTMKRFFKCIQPDVVILVESDFWLNFLRIPKKMGSLVFLINGKVSSRSFNRLKKVSFFSKALFSFFDLMCLQNELFKERFIKLGVDPSKAFVTGNLKFDIPFIESNSNSLKLELGIEPQDQVLVLASTHPKEEEEILKALESLWKKLPFLKIIIVPRHPERFQDVKELLLKKPYSMIAYSEIQKKTGKERVFLIDAMGLLMSIYQVSNVAILGGSFFSHLKGHNIFEPIQAGIPVLFGPYMSDQKDLVEHILSSHAGIQTSLQGIFSEVERLFLDSSYKDGMRKQGKHLLLQVEGGFSRASEAIFKKISLSAEKHL